MPTGVYTRSRRRMIDRFWEKVDVRGPDECWPWTKACTEGYGRFMIVSLGGVPDLIGAHIFSHWLATGEWPRRGQDVRHSCHNRACVNPVHLSIGTRLDNMRDMVEAGRSMVGERHPNHKLTWERAAEARRDHALGAAACALARRYGISERTMRQCLSGETWRPETEPVNA